MLLNAASTPPSTQTNEPSFYFHREFQLSYQPTLYLENKGLHSFETLVSLRPERAKLYSRNWRDLLEQSQVDLPLQRWVIYEACRQMKLWKTHCLTDQPLLLSINLSETQLSDIGLISSIQQILEDTQLAPQYLQLEIPGQWIQQNFNTAKSLITRLQKIGISTCIDDFEPSHFSCQFLDYLAVDTLKISMHYTHQLTDQSSPEDIDLKTISIIEDTPLQVIFKGIETPEQLLTIRDLGCTYGQGYFLAEPIDPRQATAFIAAQIQQQQYALPSYLRAMHHLTQISKRFLGTMMVTKNWQASKPQKLWLSMLKPYQQDPLDTHPAHTQALNSTTALNSSQQQDLQHWTGCFIQRCDQIIRGFSQLVTETDLTPNERKLLGV